MEIVDIVNKCQTKAGQFSYKKIALLSSNEIKIIEDATKNLDEIFGRNILFSIRLKYIKINPLKTHCHCGSVLKFSPNKDQVFRITCGNQKCAKTPEKITIAKTKFLDTIKKRQENIINPFSLEEQRNFIENQIQKGIKPNYLVSNQCEISRFISSEAKNLGIKTTQYCFNLINFIDPFEKKLCSECNQNNVSFISFKNGYSKKCKICGMKSSAENKKQNNIEKIENRLIKENKFSIISSNGINLAPWELSCNVCGETFKKWLNNGTQENEIKCPRCEPKTKSSYEYNLIKDIKNFYNGEIIHGYRLKNSRKSIDILIPEKNLGIEINGIYWHSDVKFRHKEKRDLCLNENIDLIQFTDLEINEKQDIVLSMIKNKLGCSNKIHARKTTIRIITLEEYRKFCNENHLKGYCSATIKIGLFFQDEIVAIMSLSKSRFSKNDSYEIIRFCNKKDLTVVGGFSKIINYVFKHFSEIYQIDSFVDLHHGNGNSYQKIGFLSQGISSPNYFYWKEPNKLYSRNIFQKHKLKALFPNIYSDEKTEKEIMEEAGYKRYYDCGNEKFTISINKV